MSVEIESERIWKKTEEIMREVLDRNNTVSGSDSSAEEPGKRIISVASKVVPEHIFRSVCKKIFPIVKCIERDYSAPITKSRLAVELVCGIDRVNYIRMRGRELTLEEEYRRPWESFEVTGGRRDYPILKYTDEEFTALQGLSGSAAGVLLDCMRDVVCGYECITEEQKKELEMVKMNGMCLKDVAQQTYHMCLAAVEQNGFALQFVERPTPEIVEAALAQLKDSKFCMLDNNINMDQVIL